MHIPRSVSSVLIFALCLHVPTYLKALHDFQPLIPTPIFSTHFCYILGNTKQRTVHKSGRYHQGLQSSVNPTLSMQEKMSIFIIFPKNVIYLHLVILVWVQDFPGPESKLSPLKLNEGANFRRQIRILARQWAHISWQGVAWKDTIVGLDQFKDCTWWFAF